MTHREDERRVIELAGLVCDGAASDDQIEELNALLSHGERLRRVYLLSIGLHEDLKYHTEEAGAAFPKPSVVRRGVNSSRWMHYALRGTAACIVILLLFQLIPFKRPAPSGNNETIVATISRLNDVEWAMGSDSFRVGESIMPCSLKIDSGSIRLVYPHGGVLALEGPAELDIVTSERAVLKSGRLAAYIPDGAEGFCVSTPTAEIVDLGTEFGLTVDAEGRAVVDVFDGEVELTPSTSGAESTHVLSGLACGIDESGSAQSESVRLDRFDSVRDMLRNREVIREAFYDETRMPGVERNGWIDVWRLDVHDGVMIDTETGVFDDRPLFPGSTSYLDASARADMEEKPCRVSLSRSFSSVGRFSIEEPYSIEFLIRLNRFPPDFQGVRVFGFLGHVDLEGTPAWELRAERSLDTPQQMAWRIPTNEDGKSGSEAFRIFEGITYRCHLEIDPQREIWRAGISTRGRSVSNSFQDEIPLNLDSKKTGDSAISTLACEVIGAKGDDISFSVDAIRIQNRPDAGMLDVANTAP
jgi:hypothetical protein